MQQEIVPRVSVEVGYNRRWWGNFTVIDNTLIGPADYERWTIVAPNDSRLPGGGGYPIDVYTLTAAAAARGADNYVTAETDVGPAPVFHFGKRRADIGVDLQNLLNTNDPTAYESQYSYTAAHGGTWFNPTTIPGPRFMRFNFTLND